MNVAGLSEEQRAHPSARLLLAVLDLEDELGPAPSQIIGSITAYGDTTIDRR